MQSSFPKSLPQQQQSDYRANRWARHSLTIGLVATLFLTQAIPAATLLRNGQDVPLPLAFRSINFLVAPTLLFFVDRYLAGRGRRLLSRTMLAGASAVLVGGAMGALSSGPAWSPA